MILVYNFMCVYTVLSTHCFSLFSLLLRSATKGDNIETSTILIFNKFSVDFQFLNFLALVISYCPFGLLLTVSGVFNHSLFFLNLQLLISFLICLGHLSCTVGTTQSNSVKDSEGDRWTDSPCVKD